LSGKFLQQSLIATVDAILDAIITSHTPKCTKYPSKIQENYLKNTLLCFPCAA